MSRTSQGGLCLLEDVIGRALRTGLLLYGLFMAPRVDRPGRDRPVPLFFFSEPRPSIRPFGEEKGQVSRWPNNKFRDTIVH